MTETALNQNHVIAQKRIRLTIFFLIVRISSFTSGDISDMHPRDKSPCATRKITFVIHRPPAIVTNTVLPIREDRRTDRPSNRNPERSAAPQPQSLPKGPRRDETFADIHSAKAESRRMIVFARSRRRPRCHRQNRRRPGSHAARGPPSPPSSDRSLGGSSVGKAIQL
jgi:hypothetical protein